MIQYSKLLKSYTLPNEVSGGFKLHNAKTPVMRYVHQPGFPENPREVPEFAAPPGLNRGLPHVLPFQTIGRAIMKTGLY